jgi:hypothetical protein
VRERLIFTDELIAAALARPEERRSLVQRWALFEGTARECARRQLEEAAVLVPETQRRRVLRPLWSEDHIQATTATGSLLLAKVLSDQGWAVEHEPEIYGGTPDLRIRKGSVEFVVEIRHVAGDLALPPAYDRVRAALQDIRTKTPASFTVLEVDGGASLKPFRKFLMELLREPRCGPHDYRATGVHIRFRLHLSPRDTETGVFFSYGRENMISVDERPKIRAALDEKLKKYRVPLIVALQGIHDGDMFRAAEDVMYGSVVGIFPVSRANGEPPPPARTERLPDSAALRPNSDGARVRERLNALLPFTLHIDHQRGFVLRARVLGNPARPEVSGVREFLPIPSVVPIDPERMGYVGAAGMPIDEKAIVDEFIP